VLLAPNFEQVFAGREGKLYRDISTFPMISFDPNSASSDGEICLPERRPIRILGLENESIRVAGEKFADLKNEIPRFLEGDLKCSVQSKAPITPDPFYLERDVVWVNGFWGMPRKSQEDRLIRRVS